MTGLLRGSVIFAAFACLCFSQCLCDAQNQQARISALPNFDATKSLGPGIVVESVEKDSGSDKAGLQPGDILLRWSRGEARGEFASPFDLSELETDEAPRGAVTIEGLRQDTRRTWTLGEADWKLVCRPNFLGDLLAGYLEGRDLAKTGKNDAAMEHWKKIAVETNDSPLRAWFYSQIAGLSVDQKKWKEADTNYQAALENAPKTSPRTRVEILLAWTETYLQRGDMENAEKDYRLALEESQKADPESLLTASILTDLGQLAMRRGDFSAAQESLGQALVIKGKLLPNSVAFAATLTDFGFAAGQRGDLDKAEDALRRALAIYEQQDSASMAAAKSLYGIGMISWTRGNVLAAQDYLNQAMKIAEKQAPESLFFARILNGIGLIRYQQGDLTAADAYLHQALTLEQKLAPGTSYAALGNLSQVAIARDDLTLAEKYLLQILAILERRPPGHDLAETYANLGVVAWKLADLDKAEGYLQKALAIDEKFFPVSQQSAECYGYLGLIEQKRENFPKAEEYFEKTAEIQEKVTPNSLFIAATYASLGDMAKHRSDAAKAEEYYRKSLAISSRLAPEWAEHAETTAALASVIKEKQPDVALKLYEDSIDTLDKQLSHLGGSSESRSDFRADHTAIYEEYVDLLLQQNKVETAFQVLERSRARTLLETLAKAHVDIRRGVDASLLAREKQLRQNLNDKNDVRIQLLTGKHTDQQVAAVDKEISEILTQDQEIEEQILESSPAYATLTQPHPLPIKDIQQKVLDADSILLEYTLGEQESYVFVLTQDSLKSYRLPKRAEIENQAKIVYQALVAYNRLAAGESPEQRQNRLAQSAKDFRQANAHLGQMLLSPFFEQLQNKRLLVVGDGALQYIPFTVLTPSPAQEPLIATHEIVNLPSISVLAELRSDEVRRKQPLKTVAVLADPVFNKQDARVAHLQDTMSESAKRDMPNGAEEEDANDASSHFLARSVEDVGLRSNTSEFLPRLVFSREEANQILAVAPAASSMEALDFAASRAEAINPELGQYRIVHFATHGLVDSRNPQLSGLVFSLVNKSGASQDGFLSLQDIYNLNLPVDMVVLSACETALGKEVSGEGLIGLTRGFMYAGASRVVASLWKVDDEATAELMRRFYASMFQDKLSPAAALRKAQLEMSQTKRWSNPYYWAGFELQGKWR